MEAVTERYSQPSGCQKFCMPDSQPKAAGSTAAFRLFVFHEKEKQDRCSTAERSNSPLWPQRNKGDQA